MKVQSINNSLSQLIIGWVINNRLSQLIRGLDYPSNKLHKIAVGGMHRDIAGYYENALYSMAYSLVYFLII